MSDTIKIEQTTATFSSKLDATMKLSKTVEQVQHVTFNGLVAELTGVVSNIESMNRRKEEIIDLLASVAVAQGYTAEEIEEIKSRVSLDEEIKTQLLAEIQELAATKLEANEVQVIGDVETASIVKNTVIADPVAPVEPTPVTVEEPAAKEEIA